MTLLREIPLGYLKKGDRLQRGPVCATIKEVVGEDITIQIDRGQTLVIDQTEGFHYAGRWYMYCVVNMVAVAAMNGNRGKLGAQTGHGYQFAGWDSGDRFPEHLKHYRNSMQGTKVCLRAEDEAILKDLEQKFRPICGVAHITDAAHTVFEKPTVTCLGIGPLRVDDYGDMRLSEIQRGGIAGKVLI